MLKIGMASEHNQDNAALKAAWDILRTQALERMDIDQTLVQKHDDNGMTLLHFAAREGANEIIEWLLQKKANINAQNLIGETPLDLAILYGFEKTTRLLKQRGAQDGAEIAAQKKWAAGDNSILTAARLGKLPDMIPEMLAGKRPLLTLSDLMQKDNNGESVLNMLFQKNQLDAILTPALWIGRTGQLSKLIDFIPESLQARSNCETLLRQTRQQSLNQTQRRRPPQ